MASTTEIYHGFWTNWSQGWVAGPTLTLSRQDGAYLVAFLALFVRLAGTHTWQILSYFVFRAKATPVSAGDEALQQQLVVLRNVPTDSQALWELGKISWSQRRKVAWKSQGRSIALMTSAALHIVAFAAAGIFASRVTNARSEVLLRSRLCGPWSGDVSSNVTGTDVEGFQMGINKGGIIAKSAEIVAQCYRSGLAYNSTLPTLGLCNAYGRRQLPWSVSTSTRCPFDSSMCINDTSVRLDSGLVDSLLDLGINSHPADSVSFRKVLECAPLLTDGFATTYGPNNLTEDAVGLLSSIDQSIHDKFTAFYYGPNVAFGTNATFILVNDSFDTSAISTLTPYRIHSDYAIPNSESRTFDPIQQLNRTDAQVVLMYLSSVALYPSPVTDPWFNAQVPVIEDMKVGPYTVYAAQNAANVLGCTDQVEVCNPALGGETSSCTPMPSGDSEDVVALLSQRLHFNARQKTVLGRIVDFFHESIDTMAEIRQDGELLATSLTDYWTSAELPPDQWILELDHWFAMLLTYLQLRVVSYVTGPDNPAYHHWIVSPPAEDEWMCANQIVQRDDHASFSVLGLAIILGVGGLVMPINMSLSYIWQAMRKSPASKYRTERWKATELLELQRLAENGCATGLEKGEVKLERSQSGNSDASQASTKVPTHHVSSEMSSMLNADERCGSLDCLSATTTIDMQLQRDDFPPEDLRLLLSKRAPTS